MRMSKPRPRDAGVTLPELLVVMVLASLIIATGISLISGTFRTTAASQTRSELWSQMTNTSIALIRDVNDGSRLTITEPDHLAVQVVRDGKCQTRDWRVDGDSLISTTSFYTGATCTGGSEDRETEAIKANLNDFTFTYFSAASLTSALPAPVSPNVVNRVAWNMNATPTDSTAILKLDSGAAFTGRGSATDGTGDVQTPLAGFLSVVTNRTGIEGVDAPVLEWTDATPELTQGWSVYRTMYPDGADPSSSTGWEQLTYLPTTTPGPVTSTFTDRTLPRGYTGLYIVRATVPDGYGPTSNQVASGLRPSAAVITSDGATQTISLSWTAPVGSTGFDIYRTEGGETQSTPVLYRRWSQIESATTTVGTGSSLRYRWTDTLSYGQHRSYVVVPVNRWERLATTTSQTGELPVGAALAQQYAGGTGTSLTAARAISNQTNNFTAGAAPSGSVALSSTTSATDYGTNVTRSAADWTGGGGPTVVSATYAADNGMHRDHSWETERRGGTWADVWPDATLRGTSMRKDTGTQPDVTYGYRLRTVNSSGAGPWSAEVRILQRPAVPAAPTATLSGLTTRQATVTAATSPSATSWEVQLTAGGGGSGMPGVKSTNSGRQIVYGVLRDNTVHSWQSRSTNVAPSGVAGGGTSAWGASGSVRTAELRVWLSSGSATTRSISARLNNMGGNNANLTVEGFQTQPSSGQGQLHTFDPLTHATTYTLTARLTDGYNDAVYQDNITTQRLATPGMSFGSVSTRSIQAYVSCANGNSCSVGRNSAGGYGSGTTFDPLVHGTTHGFYGRNSDGHNVVTNYATRATNTLTVATPAPPSCNVASDSPYAPTTVYFSSNGSINRSSAYAGSSGYYGASATATNSNSDGYNYVSASSSSSCGMNIAPPPMPPAPDDARVSWSRYCTAYQNSSLGFEARATWSAQAGTSYLATITYEYEGAFRTRVMGATSGASYVISDPNAAFKYVTVTASNAYGSVSSTATAYGGGCITV